MQRELFSELKIKANDPYDAVDRVIDKLSSQMSRFKGKLQKKYKGHKELTVCGTSGISKRKNLK